MLAEPFIARGNSENETVSEFVCRRLGREVLEKAMANTLKQFFREHHMYREGVLDNRLHAINGAKPLTRDDAVIAPYRIQALILVEQLELMFKAICQFDNELEKLACGHPDYALFQALPGAGPSLAPRLLVAFGEQRERFKSAADMQKYSGIAPVTERSGKKHWVHWRLQSPTFMHQTFVEWSAQTINKSYWQEPIIGNNKIRVIGDEKFFGFAWCVKSLHGLS